MSYLLIVMLLIFNSRIHLIVIVDLCCSLFMYIVAWEKRREERLSTRYVTQSVFTQLIGIQFVSITFITIYILKLARGMDATWEKSNWKGGMGAT